ncbi:MAG: 50S ribosomal protein L31, partial [Lentisphaeria bacterium]|nr:50S ribosomal protein L31 [Lentisphaeria bacterium]
MVARIPSGALEAGRDVQKRKRSGFSEMKLHFPHVGVYYKLPCCFKVARFSQKSNTNPTYMRLKMKDSIHPAYGPAKVICACGKVWDIYSTRKEQK